MTAKEYILSDYAKERIELLLLKSPLATITPPKTVENCVKIINKLNVNKNDHDGTITVFEDMLSLYDDENYPIIHLILLKALAIDNSFAFAHDYLLFKFRRPNFNLHDIPELIELSHLDNSDLKEGIIENKNDSKYPEYFFALCDLILISMKKKNKPIEDTKKGMMAYAKREHALSTTGERYYLANRDININNMSLEVANMKKRYRKRWKIIMKELSNADADVMNWLKKQPN